MLGRSRQSALSRNMLLKVPGSRGMRAPNSLVGPSFPRPYARGNREPEFSEAVTRARPLIAAIPLPSEATVIAHVSPGMAIATQAPFGGDPE